ncbi:4Fe-4S binding protein [Mycobacterium sp. E1747]|uniref:4Fe-4S binding protein n=1 Tax=Mycobacterium sp. E1747 TaxID=1834128 RepID=UPI0007FCD657|nr:4Fe-4S binding protein [Mycobacterium sp. E1747]OBH10417.1 ferredoxin [Mycobacterium sp. E1747]
MAYVITQNCCKDASCVPVCPVDCIRPVAGQGEFTDTEMLYIDPVECIDCGACLEECPVDAIYYAEDLPPELQRFRDINARYFERHPLATSTTTHGVDHASVEPGSLRVAIVGAGPAACYAAGELMRVDGVEVDLFERLPTPFGLIRAGVAPDHQLTKSVVHIFEPVFMSPRFGCHLNVEVGRDLTHEDLVAHHHAVIYAVGASHSRNLGIPGEQLAGSYAAADFVAWYNGHPDHADDVFDLSAERAVIVGNGNVALDVARVLLLGQEALAKTDIAEHAVQALAHSNVREVVIVARRGPREAAYSVGEFAALGHLPGIDVIVETEGFDAAADDNVEALLKLEIAREYAARTPDPNNKRIIFRYFTSPVEVVGDDKVTGLRVVNNRFDESGGLVPGDPDIDSELIETPLVLRSIGYRGSAIEGLPFDPATGTIPNQSGRVLGEDGEPLPGVYVTGWIKRGPRGVIGTNRSCAEQTVAQIWQDFDSGKLARDANDRTKLQELLGRRGVDPVDWRGWRAIDRAERERGAQESRPRVKFVGIAEMLETAKR